jgi:glutaredoxin 3
MNDNKRKIEVFSARCAACEDAIALIKRVACESCDVTIHDMRQKDVAARAKQLGVRSVPAVVIDGKLADCCSTRGPQEQVLRAEGLGVRLS